MKKIGLLLLSFVLMSGMAFAQKFAYVDTDYILKNIPSYESAQKQLDQVSAEFQKEIENNYNEIDKLFREYQAEKVLLTDDMRQKREDEIIQKEKEVKSLQQKYFGPEGDLYKKRQELVKPIQDEVFNAIKEIATEGNYAIIFDIAEGANILFTDPKYDKSDEVLEKLDYKN